MGRYYWGDIEGKFWFGVQSSCDINNLVNIDMVEGLVLKRKSAKLEVGSTENNNIKSQIKILLIIC